MRNINYIYDFTKKLKQIKNLIKAPKPKLKGPNKSETKLGKILGPSFKYTGNGGKTISGKIPDFVNEADKIIVELYGDYYHKNEPINKTLDRIQLFKSYGYDTIIIWGSELTPENVKGKLAKLWMKKMHNK